MNQIKEKDISSSDESKIVKSEVTEKSENENKLGGPTFYPPLYQQRYYFATQILKKNKVKYIVDLGCAECGCVRYYREISTVQQIQLIDIDRPTLDMNMLLIQPRPCNFIFRRDLPLTIQMYEGNVKLLDDRIKGCDAVTMIELIEHLYPDDLRAVTEMVFGRLHPQLVIITTPNYEFNTLFPGEMRFRHADHKFEWTRNEFQAWCRSVCDHYKYSVEFDGVGEPPSESHNVGYCTQAGIFTRSSKVDITAIITDGHCYQLVAESEYPHKEYKSNDVALQNEVTYVINMLTNPSLLSADEDCEDQIEIPIDKMHRFQGISQLATFEVLREHLIKQGHTLSPDRMCIIVKCEEEPYFEEEIEEAETICDVKEAGDTVSNQESMHSLADTWKEEDWDESYNTG